MTDFETVPVGTSEAMRKLFHMVDELIVTNNTKDARTLLKEIRDGNVYSVITGRPAEMG